MTELRVGRADIFAITDFDIPVPMKLAEIWPTVPAEQWVPYRKRFDYVFHGDDGWHNHVGCFVVRCGADVVVVDTGIGARPFGPSGPSGKLLEQLSGCGLSPDDVTTVFMTHLHFDHVGWNIAVDGAAMFPRARYVLSRGEWDARPAQAERAAALGQPPYIDACVTPLGALGVLDLVDGEQALSGELTAIPTPGHSPGHMSVLVESEGERAMILGDVLLHPAQVSEPGWSSRMDMDPAQASETRRQVLDRVETESLIAAVGHIREVPFGRVVRVEGRRYWMGYEPTETSDSTVLA